MKKAVELFLFVMFGVVVDAVGQPQLPFVSQNSHGAWIIELKGVLLLLALTACVTGPALGYVCFRRWRNSFWRRERKFKRRSQMPEYEEKIELLEARVAFLSAVNKGLGTQRAPVTDGEHQDISVETACESLARQLVMANANIKSLILAIRESVSFDREVVIELSEGGQHIFVFAGCEPKSDASGFLGWYRCPSCNEKSVSVSEGDSTDSVCRDHFENCIGFNRSASAAG
jgi:hypothetical protein